jgi:hypothetical protein
MHYEIPEEWLGFFDFKQASTGHRFYHYGQCWTNAQTVPLCEIQPPMRSEGVEPFKKYKMIPVLMAMMDPEGSLPPIVVAPLEPPSPYKYRVVNGFHRFYASAERGYPSIPVVMDES